MGAGVWQGPRGAQSGAQRRVVRGILPVAHRSIPSGTSQWSRRLIAAARASPRLSRAAHRRRWAACLNRPMNNAIRALIRRFERSLSLSYEADGSCAQPCRAGELFRVRLGDRLFALKLYDEGYFNNAYFYQALATRPVPVPAIHACGDSGELVGKPWILMDWVEGDQQITDLGAVGK
jgi:hypothetical protein